VLSEPYDEVMREVVALNYDWLASDKAGRVNTRRMDCLRTQLPPPSPYEK
jgi:hypothetical protein